MAVRRTLLLAALLILALAAAAVLYMRGDLAVVPRSAAVLPAEERAASEGGTFVWSFRTDETSDVPRTTVTLSYAGETKEVGTYDGSCAKIAATELQEGQVSGVLCWWAGAGDEIGVFKEGDGYVVKVGVQEEPTAESEGFRGDFNTSVHLQ